MIGVLLLVKLAAKLIGVWPVAAAFRLPRRERSYTTLLMATGLTYGSIAALFGLTHALIEGPVHRAGHRGHPVRVRADSDRPAAFQPTVLDTEEEEALGEEDFSLIHHRAPAHPAGREPTGIRPEEH